MISHHKITHNEWLNKAIISGITPPKQIVELTWELLVSYGDFVNNQDDYKEDVYKIAYDIATIALQDKLNMIRIYEVYRDYLLEAMMNMSIHYIPEKPQQLVRFANVVSTAFCEAHADMLKREIRHKRNENLINELKVAKSIQRHLMPKTIPEIPGFDIYGKLLPAEEVGGDYWSIKLHSDGIVTMKLADISGHGLAAATLVAAVKFISGGYYQGSVSASEVMRKTNRVLTKETPSDILVSMVYGWLNPSTFELSIVNAGLEPVLLNRNGKCESIFPTGPVMGFDENSQYKEIKIQLKKDDIVFFGSDGITEAGIGDLFGMDRLSELITKSAHHNAKRIADEVIKTVSKYSANQTDDISLLVLKVTDEPQKAI